jgi:HupE / UreJ protein
MKGAATRVLVVAIVLLSTTARAHRPSDAYVQLTQDPAGARLEGHVDVALRDLEHALALDDGDGRLRAGELQARASEIVRFVSGSLRVAVDGHTLPARWAEPSLVEHSDGVYARLPVAAELPASAHTLRLHYRLLAEADPSHRGVVRFTRGDRDELMVTGAGLPEPAFTLAAPEGRSQLLARVQEGGAHILAGLDHVLFLACLALACLRVPGQTGAALARAIFAVVSAFTLAHSLTLGAVALGLLRVASEVIEPAIAASVALSAVLNLASPASSRHGHAALAFSLGLLHGCGFAAGFADLGLRGGALVEALLGFNLGIELGQLAVLVSVLPVGLTLLRRPQTFAACVRGGSFAVLILSLGWLVQRLNLE